METGKDFYCNPQRTQLALTAQFVYHNRVDSRRFPESLEKFLAAKILRGYASGGNNETVGGPLTPRTQLGCTHPPFSSLK